MSRFWYFERGHVWDIVDQPLPAVMLDVLADLHWNEKLTSKVSL